MGRRDPLSLILLSPSGEEKVGVLGGQLVLRRDDSDSLSLVCWEREPKKLPVPHDFFSGIILCSAKPSCTEACIDPFSSQSNTSDESLLRARQGTGSSRIQQSVALSRGM